MHVQQRELPFDPVGANGAVISIVAILLVRNEDRFLDRVLRNVSGFCDRLIVADNGSTDGTPAILEAWQTAGRIERHAVSHPSQSHDLIAGLAGTDTWVFGVDGDEIYDPQGLARLRRDLLAGAHADCWRIVGHTLHCEALDEARHVAAGYRGPPSRTATKLYNFAALESWIGCGQRLHGGVQRFRTGYSEARQYRFFEHADWAASDFRCLHMAFLARSSRQTAAGARPNVSESWRGGWRAWLRRALAAGLGRSPASAYKDASYRQGPLCTEEIRAFFPDAGGSPA